MYLIVCLFFQPKKGSGCQIIIKMSCMCLWLLYIDGSSGKKATVVMVDPKGVHQRNMEHRNSTATVQNGT